MMKFWNLILTRIGSTIMLLSEFFVRGSENYLSFFCVTTRSTVLPNQYLSGSVFRDTLDSFKLIFKSALYATTESIADPRSFL